VHYFRTTPTNFYFPVFLIFVKYYSLLSELISTQGYCPAYVVVKPVGQVSHCVWLTAYWPIGQAEHGAKPVEDVDPCLHVAENIEKRNISVQ
jgi:hypothetical protein